MRPSSLVMTNGPGAVMDLGDLQSVIMLGTDFWADVEEINEMRLARSLEVDYFGAPREVKDRGGARVRGVPYSRFPRLRYCPVCFLMTDQARCPDRGHGPRKPETRTPRVVAACDKGHIDDFPWKDWVSCSCGAGQEELHLESNPDEAIDGSDLRVRCARCRKTRTLRGALGEIRLHGRPAKCAGRRPWLAVDDDCDQVLHGVMRGASNVYFPVVASSLSIPPFSRKVHRLLEQGGHLRSARMNWQNGTIDQYIQFNGELQNWVTHGICAQKEIRRAFEEAYGDVAEASIKTGEWETLTGDVEAAPGDDFRATMIDLKGSPLGDWFARISRVEALREVVALRGFTRLHPAEDWQSPRIQKLRLEDGELEALKGHNPLLPIPQRTSRRWLPAFELRGEGLFFQFKDDLVAEWGKRKAVKGRVGAILKNPNAPRPRDCVDTRLARTVLVHTFAHLVIREISLTCGYTLASLRERLYTQEGMAGVLVYTSTPDSEGSLGGLVAQGKDVARLQVHVESLASTALGCVRGPLCTFAEPTKERTPEGASCYACTHLPETSCEGLGNTLLDRRCLRDMREELGFFDPRS